MRIANIPLLLLTLLLAAFPVAPKVQAAGAERIRIAGSTSVLPIASRAAERFAEEKNAAVSITVNGGGSGVGIQSAGSGRVDIGMASREITPKEKKRFDRNRLKTIVIGRDAVACVVSSEIYEAGVRSLSKQQIRDIYLGRITNWKQVGGPDRDIVVVDKERHRGTRHVFMQYLFGDPGARAPGARLVTGSNNEEQAKIAGSDAAIGMLSVAWMNRDVVGIGIRESGKVIEPTLENIRSGTFPLARNLNFIVAGEPSGIVKEFIEFLFSPPGRKIVEESGYVPAAPS